jgi:cytochrome c556
MRRISIFAIALALCAAGLFAQDDLAQYQEHMKAAAAANMALRKGVTEKDSAAVTANSATLVTNFDWMADFFQKKGKDDGVKFAKAASAAAKAVGAATSMEDQTAALGKLGPNCSGCHMLYRAGQAFKGM